MTAGPHPYRARLAAMISGGGRTLLNLHERIGRGELDADIVLVIASRECEGAARARDLGLEVVVEPGQIPAGHLSEILTGRGVDWVVAAGYLRLIEVPRGYQGRVLNIHPALLPRHGGKGMHGRAVHEAVLRAGDAESGCTVHLVDDRYDSGAIVLQERCPVKPGDTPESLAARVFEAECETYPKALASMFAKHPGPLRV